MPTIIKYIKLVYDTVIKLDKASRFEDIVTVCRKAVAIDPYDEQLHRSLVRTLVKVGAQKEALRHYEYVTDLFFSNFGITPSEEFQSLYREIIKTDNGAEHDLNIIKDSLREKRVKPGPYLCEYEVFKDIYRLEARISARTGQSSYITVISLTGPNKQPLSPKALNVSMNRIKSIISSSLRRGDIFTRYSVSQYLIMLQSASLEKSHLVNSRILSNYKKAYPKSKAEILSFPKITILNFARQIPYISTFETVRYIINKPGKIIRCSASIIYRACAWSPDKSCLHILTTPVETIISPAHVHTDTAATAHPGKTARNA